MKEKVLLSAWNTLKKRFELSDDQLSAFKKYLHLLKEWNNKFNLTAITNDADIISYHFEDSLYLSKLVDCKSINTIADVGSGAGFPGIPLKILFPHLRVILVEVNGKKVKFLNHVADQLGLENLFIEQVDWRTFIRKFDLEIDVFCARASLQVEELVRIFKPSSRYKGSKLVYWASQKQSEVISNYVIDSIDYSVGNKPRSLLLLEDRKE